MAKYYAIPVYKTIKSELLIKVPDDFNIKNIRDEDLIDEAKIQNAFESLGARTSYDADIYSAYEDPERIVRIIGHENAPYDFQ